MIPWQLFGLTPRDETAVLLRTADEWHLEVGLATSLQRNWVVPIDEALLVSAFSVFAAAGGGNIISGGLMVLDNNVTKLFLQQSFLFAANSSAVTGGFTKTGAPICVVGPGQTLRLTADFSSAVLVNSAQFSWAGIRIPRGQMAYV